MSIFFLYTVLIFLSYLKISVDCVACFVYRKNISKFEQKELKSESKLLRIKITLGLKNANTHF